MQDVFSEYQIRKDSSLLRKCWKYGAEGVTPSNKPFFAAFEAFHFLRKFAGFLLRTEGSRAHPARVVVP